MSKFYIAMDGDDAGDAVTEAILHGTEEDAVKFSESIKRAFMEVTEFVVDQGGKIVFEGGDNLLFVLEAEDAKKVADTARGIYEDNVSHSATAGVGTTIQEAHKSLVVGKNTGKNKTVLWSEATAKTYELVQEKLQEVGEVEEEAEEEVEEELGDELEEGHDARAMHYRRLVGAGYDPRRAKLMVDRIYVYGKTEKLPGNTPAEKYLIDGENAYKKFLSDADRDTRKDEKADVKMGQKVFVAGRLGVIRRVAANCLFVDMLDGTQVQVAREGDFEPLPRLRA